MKIKRLERRFTSALLAAALAISTCSVAAFADDSVPQPVFAFDFNSDSGTTVKSSVGEYSAQLQVDHSGSAQLAPGEGFDLSQTVCLQRGDTAPKGGYIELPSNAFSVVGNDLTFSLWLKADDNPNWNQLLTIGADQSHYAVFAACGNPYGKGVGITMALKNGGEEYRIAAQPDESITVGEWAMITYTQQGDQAALYLNGEQLETKYYDTGMNEVPADKNPMPVGLADIAALEGVHAQLGRSCVFKDNAFTGYMDDVELYRGAMTAQQVRESYQSRVEEVRPVVVDAVAEKLVKTYSGMQIVDAVTLPVLEALGTTITWTSGNPEILTDDGRVRQRPDQEDAAITLTAVVRNGDTEKRVEIGVVVPAYPVQDRFADDVKWAEQYLDFIVNDSQTRLPAAAPNGTAFAWSVADGHAEIVDNVIWKTEGAAENEPLTLRFDASLEKLQEQKAVSGLILKDAYVAQLMSYFTNSDDSRGMKLSYTYDLKNFMPLNNGKAVVKMESGSKRMRDPSIFRRKDGAFGVVSTQGWDNPSIYFVDSPDLCSFENERLVPVAKGARAWAPECNYDRLTDQYYVYWSDPSRDGGFIRCNTSKDLVDFSEEACYIDRGHPIIDASIKWADGMYYMALKSEGGSVSYGTLLMAKSQTLAGPWECSGTFLAGTDAGYKWCEGPTWSKSYEDGKYYMYFDEAAGRNVIYASNPDIADDSGWVYKQDGDGTLAPEKVTGLDDADRRVSHCGVTDVTQKELDRLIEKWGVVSEEYDIKYDILQAKNAAPVTVEEKTPAKELPLPETVQVQYDDGGWREAAVEWDTSAYQPAVGEYRLEGKLAIGNDLRNTREIKTSVTVQVAPEEVHSLLLAQVDGVRYEVTGAAETETGYSIPREGQVTVKVLPEEKMELCSVRWSCGGQTVEVPIGADGTAQFTLDGSAVRGDVQVSAEVREKLPTPSPDPTAIPQESPTPAPTTAPAPAPETRLPQTGDSAMPVLLAMLGLGAICTAVFIIYQKHRRNHVNK